MRKFILTTWATCMIAFTYSQSNDTTHPITIKLLPIVSKLQYVGDHPYDWNDGAMIPAKGAQQYLNAGVNLKWKKVELQIAPEFVAAQNLSFEGFAVDMDPLQWKDYYRFYNHIELPERFGDKAFTRVLAGQSYLKYNFKTSKF